LPPDFLAQPTGLIVKTGAALRSASAWAGGVQVPAAAVANSAPPIHECSFIAILLRD
jgi:hypothetical protein